MTLGFKENSFLKPIFIKLSMNANIINLQFFIGPERYCYV